VPFHPSVNYPEYPFRPYVSSEPNYVYDALRELLHELGLDSDHWGTPEWNPLRGLINPGDKVVLKPNFVISNVAVTYLIHNVPVSKKLLQQKGIFAAITHPSLIRAIADYCYIALKGSGSIIVADAPNYNCDFEELMEITRLNQMAQFFNSHKGPRISILDLRNYWSKTRHFPSFIRPLPGDPSGTITVNLGKESAAYQHPNPRSLYGAVYHRNETIDHHSGERQEYELSRTVLAADVLISIPKLKTHTKVGMTCNMKGMVGACTNKNFLIHYTLGAPSEKGDQYPEGLFTRNERAAIKFERWMYDRFLAKRSRRHELIHRLIYGFFYMRIVRHLGFRIPPEKRMLDAGNWYGNDTAWRMVVDLAKIIYFVDSNGALRKEPQRRLFSVVDGIVGGENNGPLSPDSKPSGVLVGGDNFLAVDLTCARLMGFDHRKLKQFSMLDLNYDFGPRALEDIEIRSNDRTIVRDFLNPASRLLSFKPHPGWQGYIER
jgi:uncharacterized protein (DUF362 family)